MIRPTLAVLLFAALVAFDSRAANEAPPPAGRYETVVVAPSKTSIFVGTVSMTMSKFARKEGVYAAKYTAKVFPYFFYNESGMLYVEISDDQIRQLERGETVEFKGNGVRSDGEKWRVTGTATPGDATTGKLKVRVPVSKRIELIFNTTYRFGPP